MVLLAFWPALAHAQAFGQASGRLYLLSGLGSTLKDILLLALIVIVILIGIALVYLLRRRRHPPSVMEHGKGGVYLPFEMPTGLSLDALKARFQSTSNVTERVARRLAYCYAILFERALILSYIDDGYLRPQVEEDRLKDNTALFLSMASIETAVDGQVFRGHPENSIRSHLRGSFERQGWPWPSHPLAWKKYFLEYHMETLFGEASTNDPGASDQT